MAQQRQLLMSLNTRYYTKFAAENPRQIRISANEIKGKTQFLITTIPCLNFAEAV